MPAGHASLGLAGEPGSVGRLAPSPTGKLHLGHARTFLLAYWHARTRGGRLVMRMEDLDAPRVVQGAASGILQDLEWLGLEWDGPVLLQSTRLDAMTAAIGALVDRGLAYPCTCSRGDIRSAQSAPHLGEEEPRYPGTCRDRYGSVAEAERRTGRPAGIRFRVREGEVRIEDGISGGHAFDVQGTVGDFLVARRGGAPAYQLAVVCDDAHQGVTEVVRGDDLLASAARQLLLQEALELPRLRYWHVPLVTDDSGLRLAKRRDDLSLGELRARGVDPRAIVAWAARSSGVDVPSRALCREVTSLFSLSRLPRTPVRLAADDVARLLQETH